MPRAVQITGSPEQQRPDERIAYQVTLDASYASPSSPVCKLYDITSGETDVSSTKLSGSAAINGAVFTSPLVIALVAAHTYRLEFQFASGGNTFEPYLLLDGAT